MPAVAPTDKELVMMALEGNQSAYEELFNRHADRVFSTAYRILQQAADAEDAVQETFDRAFRNLHRFEWETAFAGWLYRIARNVALDLVRTRQARHRPRLIEKEELVEVPAAKPGTRRERLMVAMQEAIERLREPYRTTVLMALEGKSMKDIAQAMNIGYSGVTMRLARAQDMLREMLPGWKFDLSGLSHTGIMCPPLL